MPNLKVLDRGRKVYEDTLEPLLELGRQQGEEPAPYSIARGGETPRLVIAERSDVSISRRQLRIEIEFDGRVRLTNLSGTTSLVIELHPALAPGQSTLLPLPLVLTIGTRTLRIEGDATGESVEIQTLSLPRGFASVPKFVEQDLPSLAMSLRQNDSTALLPRLQQLVVALQETASSPTFFKRVADVLREVVQLDHACVLLYHEGQWKIEALADGTDPEWQPSRRLLQQVEQERRPCWRVPRSSGGADGEHSLVDVRAVVAAPILNAAGELLGAMYGDRRLSVRSLMQLDQLDAQLVEILACGVAAGLSRLINEQAAVSRRIQLERFVTREVAEQLERDPDALAGRDADVSLLFCDIVGFSRISERLTPQQTVDWIGDVMETFSQAVMSTNGTVVDYIGDEIIAMWGAPLPNAEHAAAACQAAVKMIMSLDELNERWSAKLGEPLQVGIGINSGVVRVGNTGSKHKLKYGPLGSAVNIASRVQGATRYLRTPVLITGATAQRLKGEFPIRRICQVRVKNIEQPLDLYELAVAALGTWDQLAADYALALASWEQRELHTAVGALSQLVATHREDGPSLVLLSRSIEAWSGGKSDYDPVWTLPSK